MPLVRGDRAPDFVLPNPDGTPVRFYGAAGGAPCVLAFMEAAAAEGLAAALDGIPVFAALPIAQKTALTAFVDAAGEVRTRYRAVDGTAFALDANLRVLASGAAATLRDAIASHRDEVQAPVLLIPRVLDDEICDFLRNVFETKGSVESGVEELYAGARADVLRPESKQRRDHVVEDAELMQLLASTLGRRLFPEIERATTWRGTRFEGFKLARYVEGGFFRAHRDNLSASTAHRRFSLTLNLNDGYDGGHLRFPEFGPALYRPPKGGALVFSSSMLHEVLPVTRGARDVLISFLFNEESRRA